MQAISLLTVSFTCRNRFCPKANLPRFVQSDVTFRADSGVMSLVCGGPHVSLFFFISLATHLTPRSAMRFSIRKDRNHQSLSSLLAAAYLRAVLSYARKWNFSIKMQTPAIIQVVRYRQRIRKRSRISRFPRAFSKTASSRCLVNSCSKLRQVYSGYHDSVFFFAATL